MGPIICATDYSKNAITTLKFGYALCKKLKTQLIVLHVFDMNVGLVTPMSMTFAKMQKETFKNHLEKLSDFCEQNLGVIPDNRHLTVMVKENPILEEELIQTIHDHKAEMMLMGMRGSSNLKDVIFGSSTKKMIDDCPCPLLAVPTTLENFELGHITYATDFEETDIHALKWMVNTLALPLKSKVAIVHIATKAVGNEQDEMEWFKAMVQQKVTYDDISYDAIEDEDFLKGLTNYLDKTKSKLIAMLEREHHGVLKAWTHSDKVKMMSTRGHKTLLSFNSKCFQ